jgi:DNA-directed RNA polymerase specialized sigma24 family protein
VVKVTIRQLGGALAALDPESRALLDLSLRRAMSDEEIAAVLRVDADEVARRRAELLDRLAGEVGVADDREGREELLATLPDLPAGHWQGAAAAAA